MKKYRPTLNRTQANAATAEASPIMRGRDSLAWVEPTGKELVAGCDKDLVEVEEDTDKALELILEGSVEGALTFVDPFVKLRGLEFVVSGVELTRVETNELVSWLVSVVIGAVADVWVGVDNVEVVEREVGFGVVSKVALLSFRPKTT